MRTIISALTLTAALAGPAFAQDTEFQNPCHSSPGTDFDFWVGDWVAYNYDTGVVEGLDTITRELDGCLILQDWRHMTDSYRAPGQPTRYEGMSFNTVLNDGRWQQVWIGNAGGTITLIGGLNDEGTMVLTTEPQTAPSGTVFRQIFHWDPEEDGSIHSWGDIEIQDEDGNWGEPQTSWNIRYVSRHQITPLAAAAD